MNTKKLVFMGIFTALCFIATYIIQIKISFGFGYFHFGDAVVMLSGMLLGPFAGAVAAGVGSAFADVAGGAAVYALPTFIVKALLAFAVGYAYRNLKGQGRNTNVLTVVYHAIISVVVVTGGYFVTDIILANFALVDFGDSAMVYASFGLPWNTLQVSIGTVVSILLYYPLKRPFESYYVNPGLQ